MIKLHSRPKRRERILTQHASGTRVMLNPEDGNYYALNEVGSRVWELCDGSLSVSEVVSTISQEYDTPSATIQADVLRLLEDLVEEKLVEEGESTAGCSKPTAMSW